MRCELTDFKAVKDAFGGTVNDVVLRPSRARCAWLRSRGVRTEGLELRALVPVSIRPQRRARHELGNQLAVMRGPLPVYIEDPVARLRVVQGTRWTA